MINEIIDYQFLNLNYSLQREMENGSKTSIQLSFRKNKLEFEGILDIVSSSNKFFKTIVKVRNSKMKLQNV